MMKYTKNAAGLAGQIKVKQPSFGVRLLSLCLALLAAFLLLALPLYAEGSAVSADETGSAASGESEAAAAEGDAGTEAEKPPPEGLYAPETEPLAEAACVLNVETGLVVYEKNADAPLVAASLVKMMTCILTMECMEKFGWDPAAALVSSAGKTWVYDALYGQNASTADIRKGETLSVEELLYAALLPSANEAALLLADYVATGNMTNFLYQMNQKAKSLGCTGTYFADPNGLSQENVTTARDMALIAREFMKWPYLVEIAGTPQYEVAQHEQHTAPYNIFNTNRLLAASSPYYKAYSDIAGVLQAGKTGSLGDWQNFVSQASKDGQTYIVAVLHSPNEADTVGAQMDPAQARPALVESAELYRWAFKNLSVTSALDTTQPVTELRVKYSSETDTVLLLPQDDIRAVLEVDGDPTQLRKSYDLPESVAAPVAEGTVVGTVTLSLGGTVIGSSRLMTARTVERNATLYLLTRAGEFLTGTYFRVLIVEVLIAAGIYAGLVALAAGSRQRRRAAPAGQAPPTGVETRRPAPAKGGAGPPKAPRKTGAAPRMPQGKPNPQTNKPPHRKNTASERKQP